MPMYQSLPAPSDHHRRRLPLAPPQKPRTAKRRRTGRVPAKQAKGARPDLVVGQPAVGDLESTGDSLDTVTGGGDRWRRRSPAFLRRQWIVPGGLLLLGDEGGLRIPSDGAGGEDEELAHEWILMPAMIS